MVDILFNASDKEYQKELRNIPGLESLVDKHQKTSHENFKYFLMEFALFGLAEYSLLSRHQLEQGMQFKDLFTSMFNMPELGDDE